MNNFENKFMLSPREPRGGKTAEEMSQEGVAVVEEFERNSSAGGSTYESRRVGHDIHIVKVKPGGEEVHRNLGPKPER